MSKPQKYNPSLGIQGNIENSLWEIQYRKNEIQNNKSAADTSFNEKDDALIEVAGISSDNSDAEIELADLVSELVNQITDLEARVKVLEDK